LSDSKIGKNLPILWNATDAVAVTVGAVNSRLPHTPPFFSKSISQIKQNSVFAEKKQQQKTRKNNKKNNRKTKTIVIFTEKFVS